MGPDGTSGGSAPRIEPGTLQAGSLKRNLNLRSTQPVLGMPLARCTDRAVPPRVQRNPILSPFRVPSALSLHPASRVPSVSVLVSGSVCVERNLFWHRPCIVKRRARRLGLRLIHHASYAD